MRRIKKKNTIIILVIILLGISLGYALLSSNLNINGTTSLSSNTWNIHWSNLVVTSGSVTGTQVTTPAIIKTGNTEVEYSITLSKPGDFYEFTVDAVNEGSIDAMIESFSNKTYESNGTTEKNLPSYLNYSVTYSDGVALANKQKLDAGTTEKIKVRVEFKRDIEASELPTEADTIVFKFNVVYVQADDNSIEIEHAFTGTIYRANSNSVLLGSSMNGGDYQLYYYVSGSSGNKIGAFFDQEACLSALYDSSYDSCVEELTHSDGVGDYYLNPDDLINRGFKTFIKHDVVDGIIQTDYPCYVLNGNTHCISLYGDQGNWDGAQSLVQSTFKSGSCVTGLGNLECYDNDENVGVHFFNDQPIYTINNNYKCSIYLIGERTNTSSCETVS